MDIGIANIRYRLSYFTSLANVSEISKGTLVFRLKFESVPRLSA